MKKIICLLSVIVLLCTSILSYAAPFAYAEASDPNDPADPEESGELTGVSDSVDMDKDPDISALYNDVIPKSKRLTSEEDDPESPINQWFGVKKSNTATIRFLRHKGKRLEYRSLAGQKMYRFDTFQGGCSSGRYNFYVLYNRNTQKGRIIKVSVKTRKVVKVSRKLKLDHGNDLTYDSKRKRLVCIHYENRPRKLSIIDPKTLRLRRQVTVPTPSTDIPGASEKFIKSIKGYTGIGYDREADEFIVAIMGARHYMALSSKFKPLRVIEVPKNDPYVRQGMTVKNGFIIRSFSAYNRTYNQNILYVYDLVGHFVKTIKLGRGYEIESVYFIGKKLYANTYTSYWKAKYKTVRKRVHGKKKRIRVKYYVLRRDNNVLRIRNY